MRRIVLPLLLPAVLAAAGCAGWLLHPEERSALEAARAGDAAAISRVLDGGVAPGLTDPRSGRPLIHYAAVQGDFETVSLLLAAGADPGYRDGAGRGPLYYAVEGGHAGAAEALLNAGADPDAADKSGRTPLMAAALDGSDDLIDLLLVHGADPNRRDADGATALSLASGARHRGPVRRLAAASSLPAAPWAVADVVRVGDVEVLRWMLDHGLDAAAVWDGEDGRPISLLDVAVARSPHAAVLLLDHGGRAVRDHHRALVAAALHGDRRRVEELLAAGADVDSVVHGGDAANRTALMEAARLGHLDVVELLLAAGADLHIRDSDGADALWHAAVGYVSPRDRAARLVRGGGRSDVIVALLEEGARPGAGDEHEFGALHAAAAWADARSVRRLLGAGADPERTDRNGKTPLMYAAQYGNAEAAAVLLESGARPGAVDHIGATPVTYARLVDPEGRVHRLLRGAGGREHVPPDRSTPALSVNLSGGRLMELDIPVAVRDVAGYDVAARLLPYATECRGHSCRLPPVVILPEGTVVELLHREVALDGRLHSVYMVQDDGLAGLLFEDTVHGAWPPAGAAVSQVTIGRMAHIRAMPWVESYEVDLPVATGGLAW